jgi:hypothetical protein
MKILKTILLGVLIVGFINTNLFSISPQEDDWDRDNFGKFICQILDPETGEPIKEVIRLVLYDSKDKNKGLFIVKSENTDSNGYIELELYPHIYYIQFYPDSHDSKYCVSQNPFKINGEDRIEIKIVKGKITYLQKIIKLGGILKIYTVDLFGNRFNPEEKFVAEFDISTDIENPHYDGFNYGRRDDLDDGVLTIKRLHPDKYSVEVQFIGLGYKTIKEENIFVEGGKITEVFIKMDLSDNTGIEGFVRDSAGAPVKNALVGLWPKDRPVDGNFKAITNENGYYKLTGVPDGNYYLSYYYQGEKKGLLSYQYNGLVEIKKGISIKLDIKFNNTIAELEDELK